MNRATEQQLKTLRAAYEVETQAVRDNLRSTAIACENSDRSDEALLSVGWTLRRPRTTGQPVAVPARLTLTPTSFPGQLLARWAPVAYARAYQAQAVALADPAAPAASVDWATDVPILSSFKASLLLEGYAPGTLVSVRVRAAGSRGPGPWSDALTARV